MGGVPSPSQAAWAGHPALALAQAPALAGTNQPLGQSRASPKGSTLVWNPTGDPSFWGHRISSSCSHRDHTL